MIALLLISFFVLLAVRVPIAVALGISCLLGLAWDPMVPVPVVAQRMFVSIDSFPLMAVPLYMLAGFLMGAGGISRRIIEFSAAIVGNLRGGLAHVNILASMIFAGISGSAVADTAGIGSIMSPAMKERGYTPAYATAVTAASSTIGIVIPPSIPMVIIGAMLGISVGKLFLAGVIPGLAIGLAQMAVAYIAAGREGEAVTSGAFEWERLGHAFVRAVWALLMPVIVIGGIVWEVCTPTEAGAVAVAYALIVAMFVYRELQLADVWEALRLTAESTGKVFFLIATAGLYSWLLTVNGFPELLGSALLSMTNSPTLMLLTMAALLLVITTFMESIAAMILLLPVLYPVAEQVGIDPIHFGIIVVLSIGVGLVTPPVGLCLFVAADIAGASVSAATRALVPFLAAMVGLVVLFSLVPALVTILPSLLME
jgi:tripartite ATP-independent transporter DctM subunit